MPVRCSVDRPSRSIRAVVACFVIGSLLLGSTGCKQSVDLQAVRDMASAAADARDTLNAVAGDYYGTCVRRNVYASISSMMDAYFPLAGKPIPVATPVPQPPAPIDNADLMRLPPAELAKRLPPSVAAKLNADQIDLLLARTDREAVWSALPPESVNSFAATLNSVAPDRAAHVCDKEKATAQAWQDANDVVIGYFVALGNLAGNAPGSDPYGLHGLAANLHQSSVLSADKLSAIASLGTTVIQSVFDAKRRNALAAIIDDTDGHVGNAIGFLETIPTEHYLPFLNAERSASQRFLTRNLTLARPGADAFTVLQYADGWAARKSALDEKAGAVSSYVNVLEKLRRAHKRILMAIANNDAASALGVAKLYYDDLRPDIDAIKKAYAESGPSGGKKP